MVRSVLPDLISASSLGSPTSLSSGASSETSPLPSSFSGSASALRSVLRITNSCSLSPLLVMLKVRLPALRFAELSLISHSFSVAVTGPADPPEQDTSKPPIAMSANPLRIVPVIHSSSPSEMPPGTSTRRRAAVASTRSIGAGCPAFYTRNQPFSRFVLTTPEYTPPALPEMPTQAPAWRDGADDHAPHRWRDAIERAVAWLRGNPRAVQLLLDVAAIGFILLAFVSTALSAEFLFHCVFVLLTLHAFLFGLRVTLLRIGLVSIPLLLYADAKAFGLHEPPLELTEWPLMFVIAVLVAWMADRRETTSRRYAALFRRASERLLTVQEDERRRIAGELHDGVGQVLTALTLTLDAAN